MACSDSRLYGEIYCDLHLINNILNDFSRSIDAKDAGCRVRQTFKSFANIEHGLPYRITSAVFPEHYLIEMWFG